MTRIVILLNSKYETWISWSENVQNYWNRKINSLTLSAECRTIDFGFVKSIVRF